MSNQESSSEAGTQVFRNRFRDAWEQLWSDDVRSALLDAMKALAPILGLTEGRFGLLPAVYFPRLRMGSVMYQSWGLWKEDTAAAFPWCSTYVPPPFTCFVPPIAEGEETEVGLITEVASRVDSLYDPMRSGAIPLLTKAPFRMGVDTVSWTVDRSRLAAAIDADHLVAADVHQVSAVYMVPWKEPAPQYVPMLYLHSADPYESSHFDAAVRAAVRADTTRTSSPIYAALLATVGAARQRASQWLNPKTHLLNQAGFEGLKDDLQRRVAMGELYVEAFFDIDKFKAANDTYGYAGADLIASQLIDRILFAVQRSVGNDYARYRAQQPVHAGKPNGFRALLAHVSGDEFKFFAQSDLVANAVAESDAAHARSIGELLVRSEDDPPTHPRDLRLGRVSAQYSTTALFENAHLVASAKATVSVGMAAMSIDASWPARGPLRDGFKPPAAPVREELIRGARTALDELDGLAERALFAAKRVPGKVLLSTELLVRGGRVQVSASGDARLLLGAIDGVLEGDEFEVFANTQREGHPLARVVVTQPSEHDPRSAAVQIIDGSLEQRDEYHARLRSGSTVSTRTPVAAVLKPA